MSGNIILNIETFQCQTPVIGNTYRQGADYIFNWTSLLDLYQSYGMIVQVRLFYIPETVLPEQEYTSSTIPFNANSFVAGPFPYDQTSFRVEFLVDGGDTCYNSFDIPYSSIIIT